MSKVESKTIFEPGKPNVPNDWVVEPFSKVVEVISDKGKRTKQRDYFEDGSIPVIDQGQDFIGGYIDDESMAFDGDLPIVVFGDHTRAVKFVNQRFAVGADGVKLLKPAECFDPKYFYYLLKSLNVPSRGYSRHFQFLKKFFLPIAPLEQQKRIVAEIEKQFSRLDEAVANLKRVKANLKRYKAAVLKAAVEGKLTEEWRKQNPDVEPADKLLERILEERRANWQGRGKYKEPAALDATGLPELPEGWVWASLDQIGQEGRPIIYGIIKPGPHVEDGVPYVRVTEMKDGFIDVTGLKKASKERAAKFARATLKGGDILISKDGTIGRVAVVPSELEGGNITQHVMRAPTHKFMSLYFVVWAIRSPFCQRWLTGETKGVALRGVNVEDFRKLPIPVPSQNEQDKIVDEIEEKLSVVERIENEVDHDLLRADRLRQSILKQAFSGQLVPRDPNDEPASVLLERIRATQPAQTKQPAARQRKHRTPAPKTGASALEPLPMVVESTANYGDAIASRILAAMQPGREYARADLVEPLGLSNGQWNAAIQELKRVGKVRQTGERRGARYLISEQVK